MGITKCGANCGVPDGPNFGTWILLMWIPEKRIRLPFGRITTPKIRDEGSTGCIAQFGNVRDLEEESAVVEKMELGLA